jgi:nicotinamidase-related amidase
MKSVLRTALALAALALAGSPAMAQGIIDEWSAVTVPPPPPLKPVTIDAKTTALLLLDFLHQNCAPRPRCVASAATMAKFADTARAKGVTIIYSIFPGGTVKPSDILPVIAPTSGDPVVAGPADKFIGSNLDQILKDKGIKTVIVTGTAANGAVLYTASAAAMSGYNVVVPVEGMSSDNLYSEQSTAWNLASSTSFGSRMAVTSVALMKF